jgi:regulator of sigma E protease
MSLIYILLALFGLGLLVFIHELGHYFVAKWCGMRVEVFSIGFGSPLFKWKRDTVIWQIGWLPFGGYVKIAGMELTKKNKHEYVDPYTIEGGFFAQPPLKRIAVAIAGPLANFILAFLLFTAIWAFGGREKAFTEFTQIVGWVDPHSELYAKGLRPGDLIQSYDGKKYSSSKDLLYAAMFSGKKVELKGEHIDWSKGTTTPFDYSIEPYPSSKGIEGIMTTGIEANARYLLYDQVGSTGKNELMPGSPMTDSGIRLGDRLVWADGELLFSMEQLSYLINKSYSLLTVERDGKLFLTRQPRVRTSEFLLSPQIKGEIVDWQYTADLKKPFSHLLVLPYIINDEGYIESSLKFIDEGSQKKAFALHSYADVEEPLHRGDRIIAIDGKPFTSQADMLKIVQGHKVHLIVEGGKSLKKISWKHEDSHFKNEFNIEAIEQVAALIGQGGGGGIEKEGVRLLRPVTPLSLMEFPTSQEIKDLLHKQVMARAEEIGEIKDTSKREQVTRSFMAEQEKVLLGIQFQDRPVQYNPAPWVLFGSIIAETGETLKALVSGNLHPKWLSGPVGIVQVMHHGWQIGVKEALFWVAAISLNLGFLNLLPIPVLDGGYLCLSLWEMVTKRKLRPKTMERMIIPFVILLVLLLIFLTFQDVTRLF